MQSFFIKNKESKPVTVIISPWERAFKLEAGKTMELQQEKHLKGNYRTIRYDNGMIRIVVEGEFDIPKIKIK